MSWRERIGSGNNSRKPKKNAACRKEKHSECYMVECICNCGHGLRTKTTVNRLRK